MPGFYAEEPNLSLAFNFADDNDIAPGGFDKFTSTGGGYDNDMADSESNGDFENDNYELPPRRTNSDLVEKNGDNPFHDGQNNSVDFDAQSQMSALFQGRRVRMNGDVFAEGRPVTADLDSTDELIVDMKDSGYSNAQISDALVDQGRVRYDHKTVGSRYLRLKACIAEREEKRIDEELTDWHEGEDEALLKADQLALAEVTDAIAKAKSRRWQVVARNLHKILKKDFKYSAGSCQKRFIALQNGTATIPPELDDDPIRRAEEKAARVLAKLHDKNLQDATNKHTKEQKRLLADQEKLRKALEKKERADKRAKAAEEKAKIAIEQAAKRNQKAKELEAVRAAQEAQIQMLSDGRGVKVSQTPKIPPKHAQHRMSYGVVTPSTTNSTPSTGKSKRSIPDINESPRVRMSVQELEALCVERGLTRSGTKAVLLKRLADNDNKMSYEELQEMLHARSASTEGTKEQLVTRVAQAEVSCSAWGQKHASAFEAFQGRKSSQSTGTAAHQVFTPIIASSSKRGASPAPNGGEKRIRSAQHSSMASSSKSSSNADRENTIQPAPVDALTRERLRLIGVASAATYLTEPDQGEQVAVAVGSREVSGAPTSRLPEASAENVDVVNADIDIEASIEADETRKV